MRTPVEYTNNLKNKVITKDMLGACIYSVNKRAKNYRDQERRARFSNWEDDARDKKNALYEQKEFMLSKLSPSCIHCEKQMQRERVYDYEDEFYMIPEEEVLHSNEYYDRDTGNYVQFKDRNIWVNKFYLFYEVGDYCFHTPIDEVEVSKYTLQIENIGSLTTFGKDYHDLISMQFVKKVIDLIKSGDYQIV